MDDAPRRLPPLHQVRHAQVAALCVHPAGHYPQLVHSWWDAQRDARTFPGGFHIVAHPPCAPWCRLRGLSLGNNADLGPFCVHQVRTWGGVLEHPAWSRLWPACDLPRPGTFPDRWGGWTLPVELGWWGFSSPKPTWLYIVGQERPPPLPPQSQALGRLENLNHRRRSETPQLMARWLVALAASCTR